MRRGAALFLGLAACASDDVRAPPPPASDELVFEVFHAAIDGMTTDRGRDRFDALAPALAASPTDVLCLQGVASADDRAALKSALAKLFPYSLDLATDDHSVVDDARDITGRLPDPPTRAPCAGLDSYLSQLQTCMQNIGCTRELGGAIEAPFLDCTNACVSPELDDADPDQRCFGCMQGHARVGAKLRETAARCSTELHPLVNGGQHGMMLLSKIPLTSPSLVVLPAEGTRRAIVGATLETAHGARIDVVCATLGPTVTSWLPDDPLTENRYSGPYGSPSDGWLRENELHIERLAAHVAARRGDRPAVVMGNFGTGPEIARNGAVVVPAAGPIGAQRLAQLFVPALGPGYAPSCTLCKDNPLVVRGQDSFHDRVLLAGIDASAVRESERTHLGKIIAASPADTLYGKRLPLSMQYGFRVRLAFPRP